MRVMVTVSKMRKREKAGIVGGIVLVGLVATFYGLRYTPAYRGQAHALVAEAAQADAKTAIADLQVAHFLYPADQSTVQKLADLYIKQNNPDAALKTLDDLPIEKGGPQIAALQRQMGDLKGAETTIYNTLRAKRSAEAYLEKSKILLEKGEGSGAIYQAEQAEQLSSTDETQLQLGLTYLVEGKTEDVHKLIVRMKPVEALQTLHRAELGKYQLGTALYTRGLLRSAQSVLAADEANPASLRLAGHIALDLAPSDTGQWGKGRGYLEKAAVLDPANLEGHEMLVKVYSHLKLTDLAKHQQELIDRLKSGRV
jgi:tetratricopeptide (TPR) repeat protein